MNYGREGDIEDRILNDISDNTGDDFSTEVNTDEPSDDGDELPTPQPQREEAAPKPNAKPKQGDQVAKGKGKPKDGEKPIKRDDKGNIIDDSGQIVAQKGAERRIFQQNERLKEANTSQQQKIADLTRQISENNSLNGLPKQYGLDTRDVGEAFRIAGAFKRNPVEGARMALEFALSQGASLNEIVSEEVLPNISLAAQKRMMEDMHQRTFAPIEQERNQQRAMKEAADQANQFAIDHPEATEHHDDIAKMIPEIIQAAAGQNRRIDVVTAAEMALTKLQSFAIKNGLDPNRAIGPQIEEIKARNGRQAPNGQANGQRPNPSNPNARQPLPRRQAPMPNGSRGVDQVPSNSGSLPASASNDAIVRQAMRDAGYNF